MMYHLGLSIMKFDILLHIDQLWAFVLVSIYFRKTFSDNFFFFFADLAEKNDVLNT